MSKGKVDIECRRAIGMNIGLCAGATTQELCATGSGHRSSEMKLGLLIPQFPSQTHIAMWRVGQAMRGSGADVQLISTRKSHGTEPCHRVLVDAMDRTFYLWPPGPWPVMRTILRSPVRLIRCLWYVAGLSESAPLEKLRALPLVLSAARLCGYCRRTGIQHVLVHSCANAAHVAAMCKLLGGPSYSLRLGGDLDVYGKDFSSKMRRAAFIMAASRVNKDEVIQRGIVTAERVLCIWLGVDTHRFRPAEPTTGSNRKLQAVTIGRLNRAKGHCHALKALRQVLDRGVAVKYTIVGSGPYEAEIRRTIQELGLANHVEMVGELDESRVIELLQSADVYILPSVGLGEASPVAVLEAMSCGVAAICSIIGGTPDMITDGVDGLLIDKHDEKGLAEALIRLAQNPAERRRLGVAARKRALESFDVRGTAKRLLHAIRSHTGLDFSNRKPR